jgi:aspartate/methionine/tyrosine aminotransferase
LFEHLTRLEGLQMAPYDLHYHGRWEIDIDSIKAAPHGTRALLLVSPNNPTGTYAATRELEETTTICRDRGWALIADEVFADYPIDATAHVTDIATRADVLAFTLGGASKSLGLPQIKLGWTIVGGPASARTAALDALELIADTFLSVGTPVQLAASQLLQLAMPVRRAIHDRIRSNLSRATELTREYPSCQLLRVEGGWSAPMRVPATHDEETFVLDLLQRERLLVHPGYFFDFPREAFLVISLLPEERVFTGALRRMLHFLHR